MSDADALPSACRRVCDQIVSTIKQARAVHQSGGDAFDASVCDAGLGDAGLGDTGLGDTGLGS